MLRALTCLFVILVSLPLPAADVRLLHFSDYHSHAVPFYTDDGERGGIARAIGFLAREKARGALVFSGGDTINKGAPAWSDKYSCADWPWFNDVVDAMAFGNHDADYGFEAFERCRASASYPVLSANTRGFDSYRVFERDGVRIGVFALAGPDFAQLVKTPGLTFGDPVEAARETVKTLRGKEHADVVVMIGHEHAEDDFVLAKAVAGIDVIFGSHSHRVRALTRIEGTGTWFISPGQYLTNIARIDLTVADGRVEAVRGALIPVDAGMEPDRWVARRVRRMQRALARDPEYRELFVPIATLDAPLSTAALAARTLAVMKAATKSDAALSTTSSFRNPVAAGPVTLESLRTALPYDNEIIVCSMPGAQLTRVLELSRARGDSDSASYIDAPATIDPAATYRVATTDYLANVAYSEVFACAQERSGLRVRDELRKSLAAVSRSAADRTP